MIPTPQLIRYLLTFIVFKDQLFTHIMRRLFFLFALLLYTFYTVCGNSCFRRLRNSQGASSSTLLFWEGRLSQCVSMVYHPHYISLNCSFLLSPSSLAIWRPWFWAFPLCPLSCSRSVSGLAESECCWSSNWNSIFVDLPGDMILDNFLILASICSENHLKEIASRMNPSYPVHSRLRADLCCSLFFFVPLLKI